MNISVIIPLYNKRDGILHALQSIFQQTYLCKEIIVVNDGSTDGSDILVEDLNHPLIRLIHQENAGVSSARNKGIEFAQNEWIAFLDADDEWKNDYLKEIYVLYSRFENIKIFATNYKILVDFNQYRNPVFNNLPSKNSQFVIHNYFEIAKSSDPILWTSAIVVNRQLLKEIDGFPLGVKSGEDLITWARLVHKSQIGYSIKQLAIFKLFRGKAFIGVEKRPDPVDHVGTQLRKIIDSSNANPNVRYYYGWYLKNRAIHYYYSDLKYQFLINLIKSIKYHENPFELLKYFILVLIPPKVLKILKK